MYVQLLYIDRYVNPEKGFTEAFLSFMRMRKVFKKPFA